MKTLRDVFPHWLTGGGIFTFLNGPWATVDPAYDITALDQDYFGNVSGHKIISPLVSAILGDEDSLTTLQRQALGNMISKKYAPNWEHLWSAFMPLDYNPLEPYFINESITETHNLTLRDQGGSTANGSETTQTAYGKTDTITHGKVTTTEHDVYGFNSSTATPSSVDRATESGTTADALGGTDQSNTAYSDGTTSNNTRTDTGSISTTRGKSGNLGLITTQRLIDEERRTWLWNFYRQMYRDLDEVLTIPFYDLCKM